MAKDGSVGLVRAVASHIFHCEAWELPEVTILDSFKEGGFAGEPTVQHMYSMSARVDGRL